MAVEYGIPVQPGWLLVRYGWPTTLDGSISGLALREPVENDTFLLNTTIDFFLYRNNIKAKSRV